MKFEFIATNVNDPMKLSGTLDIYAAAALRDALSQQLQQRSALVLDLSDVVACDVIALQLLCSARKSAKLAGKEFSVTAISVPVQQSCAVLGIFPKQFLASHQD
jgi:anti-anti-sigma factor